MRQMGRSWRPMMCVLTWLVPVLAHAQAQERIVPPPPVKTFVTIHVSNTPAILAAQEIARSSGISISADDSVFADAPNVTLDADDQPFWTVMQNFLQQAKLSAVATRSEGVARIILMRSQPESTSLSYSTHGPFVYFATTAVRTQVIDYSQPRRIGDTTHVRIRAMIDPQIAAVAHSETLSVSEALDEHGETLIAPDKLNSRITMARSDGGLSSVDFSVQLDARSPRARTVRSLKAKARFQLMTQEEVWDVPDIATATGRTREFRGGKYTIGSLIPDPQNPAQYILMVHVDWDPAVVGRGSPASPLIELGSIRNAIRITDIAGRTLQLRGSNARNSVQGSRDLNIWYYMAGQPDDPNSVASKLTWRIPSELITVEIPLELSELALP